MVFQYNQQKQFMCDIDIQDIGNTCLKCNNFTDGVEYYIFTKTIMGTISTLFVGPIVPDFPEMVDGLSISYTKMDYVEKKVVKAINTYINDAWKKIELVTEMPREQAYDQIPDIRDLFENLQ